MLTPYKLNIFPFPVNFLDWSFVFPASRLIYVYVFLQPRELSKLLKQQKELEGKTITNTKGFKTRGIDKYLDD